MKTEKKIKTIMAIDPSINYCGVAIFGAKSKELHKAILVTPDKITKRDGEFYDKAYSVFRQVQHMQEEHNVQAIVCELPDHWSIAGHAARESGSIEKLAFMCGLFYQMRDDVDKFVFTLPRGWKGQLSKEVTKNRIKSTYCGKKSWQYSEDEWEELNHNVCDAIGIGHWSIYGRV